MTPENGNALTVAMTVIDGGYELELETVDQSFAYRVRAVAVVSDEYQIAALSPPRVQQIDVAYEYPLSTGLRPRVETDGRDVYASEGTHVTVSVHMTKVLEHGSLDMGGG